MYIIVDGYGSLDKFTILKILLPTIIIIWEIHGVEKERYIFNRDMRTILLVFKHTVIRKTLSYLVSAAICLSYSVEYYAKHHLRINKTLVIPSFTEETLSTVNTRVPESKASFIFQPFHNTKFFTVYRCGQASLRWHALDLIEKAAKIIYQKDKKILFILVGSKPWHTCTFDKNIIFYRS